MTATALAVQLAALLFLPASGANFSAGSDNTPNAVGADTLDPPSALTLTGPGTLDWTATTDTYATGYRIFRSSAQGGAYSQIAEVTPRTTVNYVDSPPSGTYSYVVRSFHANWESGGSNESGMPFFCPADPDLRACVRFDEDISGTYLDESGNANTVSHTNGTLDTGVSGSAILGGPPAHYEIADSASLDLTTAMTIEAWVRMDSLPGSGRVGIIDNDGQFGLFVYAGTGLRCTNSINGAPHVAMSSGVWTHVACSWDGATLTVYINGVVASSVASTGTMSTANTNPVSLLDTSPAWDEPLDGSMDSLRVWHAVRSQAQICADSGLTGC